MVTFGILPNDTFFIYMDSNLMQTLEKYYIPKTIIYLF